MQDKNEYQSNDEISLVDLCLLIWQRKVLILTVATLFVCAGLGYVLLAMEVYEYKTVIELGTTLKNLEKGDPVEIESSASLLEKLKASYIPLAQHTYAGKGGAAVAKPDVEPSRPKESNLIILTSKAPEEQEVFYHELHQSIVEAVLQDHKKVLAAAQKELAAKVKAAKLTLAELQHPKLIKMAKDNLENLLQSKKRDLKTILDRQKVDLLTVKANLAAEQAKLKDLQGQMKQLDVQIELLDKERQLVQRQAEEVSIALNGIKSGRKLAAEGVDDATKALTLMMVENQVEMQRTRLERLETRLTIDIKRQEGELTTKKAELLREQDLQTKILAATESSLDKSLADAKREIEAFNEEIAMAENALAKFDIDRQAEINIQEQTIEQLQGRFDILRNTYALSVALRSLERVAPKRALILGGSGVLGVVFGAFFAFLASLVGQIKKRQNQIDLEN